MRIYKYLLGTVISISIGTYKYEDMITAAKNHWKQNGLIFDEFKYFAYG